MKRRKFLAAFGTATVGISTRNEDLNVATQANEIRIESPRKSIPVSLDEVDSIIVNIEKIEIKTENIDASKKATLESDLYFKSENIGQMDRYKVRLNNDGKTTIESLSFEIGSSKESNFIEDKVSDIDKPNFDLRVVFKLVHPSIDTVISDSLIITLGSFTGEVESSNYSGYSSRGLQEKNDVVSINSTELDLWDSSKSRIDKLKLGFSSPSFTNKSQYNAPKGGISVYNKKYSIDPTSKQGRKTVNEPSNEEKYKISEN
jgi:hypothetical protein